MAEVVHDTVTETGNQKHCLRCNHQWESRINRRPVRCPRCQSPYWDKPRREYAVCGHCGAGRALIQAGSDPVTAVCESCRGVSYL